MKKSKKMRNFLFSSIAIVLLGSFVLIKFIPERIDGDKESVLVQTILSRLEQFHFKPVPVDDQFSESVYELYLERLDGGKRFFTREDINQLMSFKQDIDNESLEGHYEFFNLSQELMRLSVDKTEAYFKDILSEPFDLDKEEILETDPEKRSFAANDMELKEVWRKLLKLRVIQRISDKINEIESEDDAEVAEVVEEGSLPPMKISDKQKQDHDIAALEKEAREKVKEDFKRWYKRIKKRKRSDNLSMFLNVLTNVFDPHTGYFQPIDKENFDITMSGSLEGIGARLTTDGEETKISSVVVGGPAWKEGSLEADDIIQMVAQDGAEPVDISGWDLNDVVKIIRGKKGTIVHLHTKKKNGSVKTISIERDLVVMEDLFAKSLILGQEEGERYGYIKLPKFYADFNRKGGKSCSVDVANEIQKLKSENVDGIILDLRNNGGGSLRDVVTMSGLFIEEGPIVQVKSRFRAPQVHNDRDDEAQYSGPLVVMVNSFSASASEILAAAMQDYDRAIIVGSKATYGKGTVQSFLELDRFVSKDVQPLGDLKLTTQKFYRINGGSTQLKGVESDIVMPDDFSYIEKGEREMEHPLEWTEIDPVKHSQKAFVIKNRKKIIANSQKRIKANQTFAKIEENAKRYKTLRDESQVQLNFDDYLKWETDQDKIADEYDDIMKEIDGFYVNNLMTDVAEIQKDSSNIVKNEDWVKNVKKDPYIYESVSILKDMK